MGGEKRVLTRIEWKEAFPFLRVLVDDSLTRIKHRNLSARPSNSLWRSGALQLRETLFAIRRKPSVKTETEKKAGRSLTEAAKRSTRKTL